MLDKLVLCPANRDGVTLHLVARLGEGERSVLLGLPEFGAALRQSLEETLIGIVYAPTYVLATLRVQVLPQSETAGLAQLQHVDVHVVQRNVLSGQSLLAP